ncbi:MAG: hypothetical protein ACK5M3_01560 [Dysgonomonas sp.]
MKKELLFVLMLVFCFSCNEMMEDYEVPKAVDNVGNVTKAYVDPAENIYFDWETIKNVTMWGYPMTLPWYAGSAGNIPYDMLTNYRKEDGWEMLYNFTSSSHPEAYNSLTFYNKLTGHLRYYVYSKTPSSGTTTFLGLECINNPKLLNFSGENLAMDKIASNVAFVSNMTSVDAKGIAVGWNCFEIELAYDPTLSPASNSIMNLKFYDKNVGVINAVGNISLEGEGSITTTSTSNPVKSGFNSILSAGGNAADKYVSGLFKKKEDNKTKSIIGSILGSAANEIIKAGMNLLPDSWFSKYDKTTENITKLSMKTKGNIDFSGTITSNHTTTIKSPNLLPVPGSKLAVGETVIPLFNNSLGVWSLKKTPEVILTDTYDGYYVSVGEDWYENAEIRRDFIFDSYPELEREYLAPTFSKGNPWCNIGKDDIYINPATLACISKYEVSAITCTYFDESKYSSSNIRSFKELVKSNNKQSSIIYADENTLIVNGSIYPDGDPGQDLGIKWVMNHPKGGIYLDYPYKRNDDINHDYVVKVTLKLYPKAPYNQDVIMMTKTFKVNKIIEHPVREKIYQP